MKTMKVTYQTREGRIFRTLKEADTEDQAIGIMVREYAFDRITILKIRPSKKLHYKNVCNKLVKL